MKRSVALVIDVKFQVLVVDRPSKVDPGVNNCLIEVLLLCRREGIVFTKIQLDCLRRSRSSPRGRPEEFVAHRLRPFQRGLHEGPVFVAEGRAELAELCLRRQVPKRRCVVDLQRAHADGGRRPDKEPHFRRFFLTRDAQ